MSRIKPLSELIDNGLYPRIGKLRGKPSPTSSVTGEGISASATDISARVSVHHSVVAVERLNVKCNVINSGADAEKYLRIEPASIWLLPSNGFSADFTVYSNATWTIE